MTCINKIKKYLIEVKNSSPLRIGNGDNEGIGILIQDDFAIINGTTIAGIFKEFLLGKDQAISKIVFPEQEKDTKQDISKVYFYDSPSEEKIITEDIIGRTHIKLDKNLGSAEEKHLFNEYHIVQGKKFCFRFDVMGLNMEDTQYEILCKYVEEFISEIAKGHRTIGSKSTFGFGKFEAIGKNYYFKEYDLSKEEDLDEYLNITLAAKKDLEEGAIKTTELPNYEIIFRGYCEDGFIINDDYKTTNKGIKVNVTHKEIIEGEDYYVIPSSTIKGIVRGYSNKIYETLGKDVKELEGIFGVGNSNNNQDSDNNIRERSKGKVTFNDCKIKDENGKKSKNYSRIKIDRFTGGNMNLFHNEVVIIPKTEHSEDLIEFRVTLKDYDEKAIALILLTFRDIGLGYVTIGSGNNVGYGRFKGESISVLKPGETELKVTFNDSGSFQGNKEHIDELNKIIEKL